MRERQVWESHEVDYAAMRERFWAAVAANDTLALSQIVATQWFKAILPGEDEDIVFDFANFMHAAIRFYSIVTDVKRTVQPENTVVDYSSSNVRLAVVATLSAICVGRDRPVTQRVAELFEFTADGKIMRLVMTADRLQILAAE